MINGIETFQCSLRLLKEKDLMNKIKSGASISLPFEDKLGKHFYSYAIILTLLSFNIIPKDIIIALSVVIFAVSSLEECTFMYTFSLPWMYVATFSFGLTLSLIQSVIFIGKIIYYRVDIKFRLYEIIYMFFLIICGGLNLLLYHSFTGVSFVFYFAISTYFYKMSKTNEKNRGDFWQLSLYSTFLSCFGALLYGLINNTSLDRWISGIGYAKQLYGTMGTTRFGFYLCIALLFVLFYIENKMIKTIFVIVVSICILSTISITAITLMLCICIIYYFEYDRIDKKRVMFTIFFLCIIGLVVAFWSKISQISLIKPISFRFNHIIEDLRQGNIDAASTGRADLSEVYIQSFKNGEIMTKLFGSWGLLFDGVKYSHNSYLDMLNYFGVVGIILTLMLQIMHFFEYKKFKEFKLYLLLKFAILFPAATVSIFSAQFWQIWLFI